MAKYKILVIEDDPTLRQNISLILESEDYIVETAEDGRKGIEKISSFKPDLVLSDIMMPDMDGFMVLEEMIKDSYMATIPLIFLTAKTDIENLRKGMTLGADDYILKPFHIDDLLKAIKVRIQKKESSERKLNEEKNQILSKMHHDLRTPMMPILGYSETISELDDLDEIKELTKAVNASGKKLYKRIEKFLTYSQLVFNYSKSNSDNNKKAVINNDVLERYLLSNSELSYQKERIEMDSEPAELPVSPNYVKCLIEELVENALTCSGKDEKILIKGYRENGSYKLEITDHGKGLTEEEIKKISSFKKFGDNPIASSGLGLGLAIVKRISELNKIEFNIESKEKNTTCTLTFPLNTES